MAEALITEGRTLVSAGISTDEGYIQQDPADVLSSLKENEARLRRDVMVNLDDVNGALQFCAAKAELLLLEGRLKDAQGLWRIWTEDMIKAFGPRQVVRELDFALSQGGTANG